MLSLALPSAGHGPLKLLCLGAHADDIEIGCGGTILRLVAEVPELVVRWIVFSGTGPREAEARDSAAAFLEHVAEKQIQVLGFRDGYFPFQGADIKDCFEAVKRGFDPSLILTHWRSDAHQDHRLLAELTHNTFRDHLVLEYEIPKYDGDLGTPNVFVPVAEELAREKARLILEFFGSQRPKHWFDEELFLGLMRVRGMEGRSESGYAEAFTCRKLSLAIR